MPRSNWQLGDGPSTERHLVDPMTNQKILNFLSLLYYFYIPNIIKRQVPIAKLALLVMPKHQSLNCMKVQK